MARRQAPRPGRNFPSLLDSLGHAVAHNLTLILAIAFLFGIGYTLERIGSMLEDAATTPSLASEPESTFEPSALSASGESGADARSPLADDGISEATRQRIEHFRRCGFREYREKHYDSCVRDGSVIWRRPYRDSGAGNTV
ncbi:MAG: hypothetical protein V2I25_08980 [Woeseiaceae bacterium]|jgi:hypothetical protein|nr:hypothetical protein [Woeseiaceae bacterium]